MSATFAKTPGWLDWHQNPSTPRFELPPGAVDAHCHVFGPGDQFPYAPERKYTPCDASREQLFALRDHLGISRNVIVQATCHGADNSAMLDAVQAAGGRARGIATVRPDVTEAELRRLDRAGVRGVRFNFVKRLVSTAPKGDLATIAQKIAAGRRSLHSDPHATTGGVLSCPDGAAQTAAPASTNSPPGTARPCPWMQQRCLPAGQSATGHQPRHAARLGTGPALLEGRGDRIRRPTV